MLQNLLLLLTFNIRLLKGIPFASEAMGKGVKKISPIPIWEESGEL
jgi:hypothetical protein